jgi:ribosomal protein S18 acetylase RimI-like enzyme
MRHSVTAQTEDLIIRPIWREDVPFIGSSWLHSMSESKPQRRRAMPIVGMLINASQVRLVACDRNDPSHIFGWIVAGLAGDDEPVIAYCYVKFLYRRMGIATKLVSAALRKMDSDLGSFRSDNPEASGYLVHSFQGIRSERVPGEKKRNLTPYEHVRQRYRMTYDPHALLVNAQDFT